MSNLIKYDPFAELQALQQQFFGDDWLAPMKSMQMPTTDVYTEDDKQLAIEAHLPNFDNKDIDVHVDGDSLIIRAEKHEKETDKNKKYIVRESSSSFYRRIRLPNVANKDEIKADMVDGVLKVVVPFKELPSPKKISISSSKKDSK
jgi:HSP20 family protein